MNIKIIRPLKRGHKPADGTVIAGSGHGIQAEGGRKCAYGGGE